MEFSVCCNVCKESGNVGMVICSECQSVMHIACCSAHRVERGGGLSAGNAQVHQQCAACLPWTEDTLTDNELPSNNDLFVNLRVQQDASAVTGQNCIDILIAGALVPWCRRILYQLGIRFESTKAAWVRMEQLIYLLPGFMEWFVGSQLLVRSVGRARHLNAVIHGEFDSVQIGKPFERHFSFLSNGANFGVTQYALTFMACQLQDMEASIFSTLRNLRRLKPATVDISSTFDQTTLFFGYRHRCGGGYATRASDSVYTDVDEIPPWLVAAIRDMEHMRVIPVDWVNQVVVNVSHSYAPGLGVHMDNAALFDRPSVSLRLFAHAAVSFGCRGQGLSTKSDLTVKVDQERGFVTVMDHFAANYVNSCVGPADLSSPTASIIFRRVLPTAVRNLPEPPVTSKQKSKKRSDMGYIRRHIVQDMSLKH